MGDMKYTEIWKTFNSGEQETSADITEAKPNETPQQWQEIASRIVENECVNLRKLIIKRTETNILLEPLFGMQLKEASWLNQKTVLIVANHENSTPTITIIQNA